MNNKRSAMPIVGGDEIHVSSDEFQSEDDSLAIPVKRKRGRPITTGNSKLAVPKKPVVPRGRGRPRKAGKRSSLVIVKTGKGRGRPKGVEKVDELEDVEKGYASEADAGDISNAYMSPAKGRGRSKKA